MHPRLFQFGHFAIPTYGAASAIAVVAALGVAMRLARRLDLPPEKIWNLGLYTLLAGLIVSRLLMVVTHPALFVFNPTWLLGLSPSYVPWIPWVSAAIAAAVAWLYIMAERLPLRGALDAWAPALAVGFAIRSIGAFFGGAAFGTPTHSMPAIVYGSNTAALWYHTPLHLYLVPVQLYDAAVCVLLFVALHLWIPRRRQPGEIAGLWLLIYGLAVFFLQFYRGDVFSNGVFTPMQRLALAAVILSAPLLIRRTTVAQPQPVPSVTP